MSNDDEPKSLRDPEVLRQRLAMINEEHVAPLTRFVEEIRRQHPGAIVPYFDPLDGGVGARVLFLLETPGRKASHFVSRNNPDETAKNMFELQQAAGISRHDTIFWNVVAWYLGDGKRRRVSRADDFDQNRVYLEQVLSLLGRVQTVVLLGNRAQKAWDRADLGRTDLVVHRVPHTSPMSLNTNPTRRPRLLKLFREIAGTLGA
jgi:uracil-DNA glycosylase